MMRRYYCLSCKATFEREIERKKTRMECPTCHDETYVRYATPKQVIPIDKRLSWERRSQLMRNKLIETKVNLELQKFKLVYEHNLVAALKKHVKSKEEFFEALRLAKMQTGREKKALLNNLELWGCVKNESDLGWEFRSPKRANFDKAKQKVNV